MPATRRQDPAPIPTPEPPPHDMDVRCFRSLTHISPDGASAVVSAPRSSTGTPGSRTGSRRGPKPLLASPSLAAVPRGRRGGVLGLRLGAGIGAAHLDLCRTAPAGSSAPQRCSGRRPTPGDHRTGLGATHQQPRSGPAWRRRHLRRHGSGPRVLLEAILTALFLSGEVERRTARPSRGTAYRWSTIPSQHGQLARAGCAPPRGACGPELTNARREPVDSRRTRP